MESGADAGASTTGSDGGGNATEEQGEAQEGDQEAAQSGGEPGSAEESGGEGAAVADGQGATAAPVDGFREIPIEQTVIACAEKPDSTVGEVIGQRASAGSDTSGG
jgi:hypothetical protein